MIDKRKNVWLSIVLSVIGAALIVLSCAVAGSFFLRQNKAQEKRENILSKMEELMPAASLAGVPESSNKTMAALTVDGEDFAAVLSVPACNIKLPVGAYWDKDKALDYPCRYIGSIYSERLVVGCVDMGLADAVCVTDNVYLTDTEGNRYAYTVMQIDKIKEPNTEAFDEYEG